MPSLEEFEEMEEETRRSLEILDLEGDVVGTLAEEDFMKNLLITSCEETCSRLTENSDPFKICGRYSESFAKEADKRGMLLLNTIQRLRSEILLPVERDNASKSIDEMVSQYIGLQFRQHYDLLSEELFQLKREITVEKATITNRDGSTKGKFEIPLLFKASLGRGSEAEYIAKTEDDRYKLEAIIKSKVPPITKEARENARLFRRRYMQIFSEALANDVIGPFVHRDLESELMIKPSLSIYWIPKSSELNIRATAFDKDPLLVAKVYGYNFLVSKWDVEGEEPLDHYLAEFTDKKQGELF